MLNLVYILRRVLEVSYFRLTRSYPSILNEKILRISTTVACNFVHIIVNVKLYKLWSLMVPEVKKYIAD